VSRGSEVKSKILKLLGTLRGSYKPSNEEAWVLAEVAKLNKLYLAYLKTVRGVLEGELLREEAKYKWFMENAVEVISALKGLNYALYKFRRPVEHVSVDLDVLIERIGVPRAVKALRLHGFKVVITEPYTVTLERRGFIVDLYTEPSFAWTVYMDGGRLLRDHVEEVEVNGIQVQALTREAEVVVAAAHALYKEHLILLIDCLLAWEWLNSRAWRIAVDLNVKQALRELLKICNLIKSGLTEAPYKLEPHIVVKAYIEKTLEDPVFRATLPNTLKYIMTRKDIGATILRRITRKSY
jgi:hypothetical protein